METYNLLTWKPVIYAANVAEDDLADDGADQQICTDSARICSRAEQWRYL